MGIDQVYTCFKSASWPLPANLSVKISQAGTEGWLDSQDYSNISITPLGENLVEHELGK